MNKLIALGVIVAAVGCGGGKGASNGGAGGAAGASGGATGTAGTTGSGGSSQCAMGSEGCTCYGNDTCDGGLQCLSHLCVSVSGTGGSATGTGGSATGTGGSATGTGGSTTGTGGSATGTGGSATGTGGSATTGSAGTTGAGGSGQCSPGSEGCACYGNDTCNGSLKCLSHLCVALGGTGGSTTGTGGSTTGTAGTTGTGGSGTGGTGTAGTTGTGGSGTGGTGTTGTNGNTLAFNAGVIVPGTNSFGISGGIYTFGDGVGSTITPDCTTDTCFGSVTGTGPFCVSGTGVRVPLNSTGTDYDYATYWGAALGMDLNNPTNAAMAQLAYVASTHGVTGFQFSFQNKASSTVRVTYKVRDTATNMLLDYCVDLSTSTSIIHFSDTKLQCYLSTPGPALTAALADHIEGIQWMVPTSPAAAVPFSYCINNITPITN